jgi:hypothetical protein
LDSDVLIAIIGLVSGLTVATVGALVKGALEQRAATDEELRAARVKAYPWVWRRTAAVSWWPEGRSLSADDLVSLHLDLRAWYFGLEAIFDAVVTDSPGGLYLSDNGKERYNELQKLIGASLNAVAGKQAVPDDIYIHLRDSCSAFRTALTEDLETRRKRAVLRAFELQRRHRKQKSEAKAREERIIARSTQQSPQASKRQG